MHQAMPLDGRRSDFVPLINALVAEAVKMASDEHTRAWPPQHSLSLEHLAHGINLQHRVGQQLLELGVL